MFKVVGKHQFSMLITRLYYLLVFVLPQKETLAG